MYLEASIYKDKECFEMKNLKTSVVIAGLVGVVCLVFLTNPPLTANPPICAPKATTPTYVGVLGSDCTQATANLTSLINDFAYIQCFETCGPPTVVITNPCHPEGSQICVSGYGTYRCKND